MNFLFTFGASLQAMRFAKRQLDSMHKLIDSRNIPVEKSDEFYQQATRLEQATGYSDFTRRHRHFASAQKCMNLIAYVVTGFALLVFLLSKFGPFTEQIHAFFSWLMSDFMLFAVLVSAGAGVLLLILVGLHFYTRTHFNKLLGSELSRLWQRIIDRWSPNMSIVFANGQPDPDTIATYVDQHAGRPLAGFHQ